MKLVSLVFVLLWQIKMSDKSLLDSDSLLHSNETRRNKIYLDLMPGL